jgi:YggT family protein
MVLFARILEFILIAFVVLLFARVAINLATLFARDWRPRGLTLVLVEAVLSATDPPVRFLRSVLPEINLGGARLDLSVLVLMVVATILIDVLASVGRT